MRFTAPKEKKVNTIALVNYDQLIYVKNEIICHNKWIVHNAVWILKIKNIRTEIVLIFNITCTQQSLMDQKYDSRHSGDFYKNFNWSDLWFTLKQGPLLSF